MWKLLLAAGLALTIAATIAAVATDRSGVVIAVYWIAWAVVAIGGIIAGRYTARRQQR